ncbi:MAG: type II toxin-antitoxin system RelE/ParE family toxin [Nitrospira sp.]|nr:type II toxin-antitoxin system RelE/ParE family toxin [Nitrospira sp.]
MAYSVLLAPPVERQLKALTGANDLYCIHEGSYRIIYTIQGKELIVLVLKISDRKEVYR